MPAGQSVPRKWKHSDIYRSLDHEGTSDVGSFADLAASAIPIPGDIPMWKVPYPGDILLLASRNMQNAAGGLRVS